MSSDMPITLDSIAAIVPEPRFGTEDMLALADDRFSPGLASMIRSLGVQHRHSILANYSEMLLSGADPRWETSGTQLAARAARQCLEKVSCPATDVGFVIGVTSTPSRLLPGMVSDLFAHMPELPRDAMNVSMQGQGCAPLLKAVDVARWFLHCNPTKYALVVCMETTSAMSTPCDGGRYVSFKECVNDADVQRTVDVVHGFLFADAAVALLLGVGGSGPIFGPAMHLTNADAADSNLGYISGGGSDPPLLAGRPAFMLRSEIGRRGAHYAMDTVHRLLGDDGCPLKSAADAQQALVHTGSNKILDGVRDSLRLTAEQTQVSYDVLRNYGNITGASLGFMIAEALRRETLRPGPILLTTFGIGFSASAAILTVAAPPSPT